MTLGPRAAMTAAMDQRLLPQQTTMPQHLGQTLRLAAPLAVAQLAHMAMGVTDTVMLGALGRDALAAGGLGASLLMTVLIVLQGVLASVSVLVAQARGAGREGDVPRLYWTGMVLAVLLMVPAFALFSAVGPLLLLVGEPPALVQDVEAYVAVLRWSTPGALIGLGLMRAFLPAVGGGGLILWTTLAAAFVNAGLCYALIHGAWFLPALGLRGAALATTMVLSGVAIALTAALHLHPARRRFVGWSRPSITILWAMLRLGVPIGATFAVETGLFLAIALLIGLLGPAPLAAQQVAVNTLSVAFMIPLGIAQAANVRVGNQVGARDPEGARTAGLAAIALGAGFELVAALIILIAPAPIVAMYLDPTDTEAFAIAIGLLQLSTVFLIADGIQCVASGALRGLGDTKVPFALAAIGYWGIGFPAAWFLTMRTEAGAAGAWSALAASLAIVATLLTRRFLRLTRRAQSVAAVLAE